MLASDKLVGEKLLAVASLREKHVGQAT